MFWIKINFEEGGRLPVALNEVEGHQSLLEACLKNGINMNHDCGGVCSCSSCHLYAAAAIFIL